MKLNARTAVKIARPGKSPSTRTGSIGCPSQPSSPTRRPVAGHRDRGTTARREARSRCPRRGWRARATGPTTFGSTSRTSARRAELPSSRVAQTYRHRRPRERGCARPAHRTATRRSRAQGRRSEPAPEGGGHDHRQDDRGEREDEICSTHDRSVRPAAEVAGEAPRVPPIVKASTTRRSPSGSEMRASVDHAREDVAPSSSVRTDGRPTATRMA